MIGSVGGGGCIVSACMSFELSGCDVVVSLMAGMVVALGGMVLCKRMADQRHLKQQQSMHQSLSLQMVELEDSTRL
jgi:hypothetical protein